MTYRKITPISYVEFDREVRLINEAEEDALINTFKEESQDSQSEHDLEVEMIEDESAFEQVFVNGDDMQEYNKIETTQQRYAAPFKKIDNLPFIQSILEDQETETFKRTTMDQLKYYLNFVREHPDMQPKRSSIVNSNVLNNLWEELANNLNNIRGPKRSAQKWKAAMAHWRNQLHCRTRKLKAKCMANGDEAVSNYLDSFKEEALQTLGDIVINKVKKPPALSNISPDTKPVELESRKSPEMILPTATNFKVPPATEKRNTKTPTDATTSGSKNKLPVSVARCPNQLDAEFGSSLPKRRKKTNELSPEMLMMKALESMQRRDERETKLLEELSKQGRAQTQLLERISIALEKIAKK